MRQYLALTIASSIGVAACAACSLIYNPSNLPAAHDAAVDAEIIDPTNPEITSVAPAMIYEGQGDSGSRPALVVINGRNLIDSNTVVEITAVQHAVQLSFGTPVIASSGHAIALAITAHVDRALGANEMVALDVKVTQTLPAELGGATRTVVAHDKLTLVGLKELDSMASELVSGEIDTAKLAPRYAKVDLSNVARVQFTGTARAVIVSMSSIATMQLEAIGGGGAGGNDGGGGGQPIAGGCVGGGTEARGGCAGLISGDGGKASSTLSTAAGGGGGGGFADVGATGGGMVAGTGGSSTGDPLIVTYTGTMTASANRAGGGGGGGNPQLGGKGGGGGAGGGWIDLTAYGDLSVAAITADGGPGGAGSSGLGNGAGGGGGAGGVIMLRTDGALATSGALSVAGGAGGMGVSGNGDGGRGSDGRVRWDALTGGPPSVSSGMAHRGPTIKLDTQVFRTQSPAITVIGTTNDRFDVYWESGGLRTTGGRYSLGASNAVITPMLREGFNRLCLTLLGGDQGSSEADKCVDVAYLP
jgi:hypothetical protein